MKQLMNFYNVSTNTKTHAIDIKKPVYGNYTIKANLNVNGLINGYDIYAFGDFVKSVPTTYATKNYLALTYATKNDLNKYTTTTDLENNYMKKAMEYLLEYLNLILLMVIHIIMSKIRIYVEMNPLYLEKSIISCILLFLLK